MAATNPTRIGIVTGDAAPGLTDDGRAVRSGLEGRGHDVDTLLWHRTDQDWDSLDVLLVRSCWEYHEEPSTFLELLRAATEAGVTVLNPPEVIRWNMHKSYLVELDSAGIAVAPTVCVEQGADRTLADVLDEAGWTDAVVKPAIGTSSEGVWRVQTPVPERATARFESALGDGDLLVQQFLPEIAAGELSFVFFGGEYSHANRTIPEVDDFRAHGTFGASSEGYSPAPKLVADAREALAAAADALSRRPADLVYARVDGVRRNGEFTLLELELIEPYLGLSRSTGAVERFVDGIEHAIAGPARQEGHA